jgi:FKBP-type peptidyl-prolyl cis-trans isomerase (trigger factor)
MEFSIKETGKTNKEVFVSIPAFHLDKYMEKALEGLSKGLEAKGFRKGKVPKEIAQKEIGEQEILQEASVLAIRDAYAKILKEQDLDVLGRPKVEIIKLAPGNPFEFKIKIDVLPEIKMPDYKEIAKKHQKKEVKVEEKEVEEALKRIERAKDKIPPEQKGQIDFENTEELKKMIRNQIRVEKDIAEKQKTRNDILKEISEDSHTEIPEVLVEAEKSRAITELKGNVTQTLKMSFEDYLKKANKTEQELEESLVPEIKERIKRFLILREIEKQENIEVSEEELEKEVEIFLSRFPEGKEKQDIDKKELSHYLRERLQQEKTLRFLEDLV